MGVFERKRTDGGIGVTSFGREAIRRSLSEADRQYLAHLANVKTEMEARDDVSAREAREEGGAAQPLG